MDTAGGNNRAGTGWLLKMAWRDGKASTRRLFLFMSAIVLGIAALVAIQNFGITLEETIAGQSKELMGADFLIDMDALPGEETTELIRQSDSVAVASAREASFVSMASFQQKPGTKLVRVRAMEGNYPFYGELLTNPSEAASGYQQNGMALVDASLMLQFNLQPGDSIKLGNRVFHIGGSILEAPGNTAVTTSVAPAVWIPYSQLDATGLIQTGSRVGYNFYFKAPAGFDLEAHYNLMDPELDINGADMDLHTDTSQRLGRRFNNVGRFLKLVAFIALLLGCLGIASSVHIYMKEKRQFLAILKCLGASRKQSFLIFLIQIIGIGLLGGILGTSIGLLLQQVFPLFIQDFLPVDLEWATHWTPVLLGLSLGVFMSVLFGLLPLLGSWFVSPLAVLRIQEGSPAISKRLKTLVFALILLGIWLVANQILGRPLRALGFVAGLAFTFAILALIAWGLMRLIRRYFPNSWNFEARQGLRNLFRPNNQTLVLILAIGIGSFLISTLYFTQDMLLARAKLEDETPAANLILLDVQAGQEQQLASQIKPKGFPVLENIPIVTMRLEKIKDRTVEDLRKDTTATVNGWILNHEFRTTYRDSLIGSETLLSGEWVPQFKNQTGPVPISLSSNVAQDAEVVVGDTLLFNVQGVQMETVVGSIREVDWGRLQLNFSIVFPTGVLEAAPRFHVLTTYAEDAGRSAALQQELVRDYPNISVLDIRQLLEVVGDILDKIGWIIRFMAFFSILTGLIVLLGAVRTSKVQRIRESVLLRTLGARTGQILKITALEYLFLGAIGSVMGSLLALGATQLLAYGVFEMSFVPSWIPFLVVVPGISLLVLGIGLFNSRPVLNSPPLQVLRREGL
ncbi:ABC transporter permease [Robiginitalea sp. IMCC44478]|uniref:ABC transporter permease n=1 Tax=Robiginitalea sp. IMCC44478 TaxID=3459122 RepID=UPI0040412210